MAQPPMLRVGSYEGRKQKLLREVWSWNILYVALRSLGFFLKGIRASLDFGSHSLEGQGAMNSLPRFCRQFTDRLSEPLKSILEGLEPK